LYVNAASTVLKWCLYSSEMVEPGLQLHLVRFRTALYPVPNRTLPSSEPPSGRFITTLMWFRSRLGVVCSWSKYISEQPFTWFRTALCLVWNHLFIQ